MTPMTDDEIKALARALLKHEVFMSDCIRTPDEIPLVFMTLNFMKTEDLDQMKKDGVVHLWECLKNAGPLSMNGYPLFFSHHAITKDDYTKVRAEWRRLREAIGEPVTP